MTNYEARYRGNNWWGVYDTKKGIFLEEYLCINSAEATVIANLRNKEMLIDEAKPPIKEKIMSNARFAVSLDGLVIDTRNGLSYGTPSSENPQYTAEELAMQMNRAFELGYRAAQEDVRKTPGINL